jgi:putative membrane protein
MDIDWSGLIETLFSTIVLTLIGVTLFTASVAVASALMPFSLKREIEEKENLALAVLLSAIVIGLSIVLAAALGG